MLLEYVQAAMRKAKYEILPDGGTFYGQIPECPGVWAEAPTLEACRAELQEALEDWILVGVWHHHPLPVIDGVELSVQAEQEVA